jgi:exopolysaccharide production protein ExoY
MIHPDHSTLRTFAQTATGTGLYVRHGKRALDLILAVLMLPIVVPVILLLWLIVRLQGGPGFFGHARIGQDARPFRCWKIRTMAPDADRRLAELLQRDPLAAVEWARHFKLNRDPRITRIGVFLRRTSLDELPQIWNVLRGDMSFVGPRPVTVGELAYYGADQRAYLALRPGITGLWQVHGRRDGSYARRVMLDRSYAQVMSLTTDLALILRTGLTVIRPTGC